MKTASIAKRRRADDDEYPSSDGQPLAETQVHVLLMLSLYAMLRHHFRNERVLVAANIFMYYREGDPKARTSPDLMVIKGVEGQSLRRSFFTWKERAVPSWVLELTSKGTAYEDQKKKKALYRKLKVREYFLFDPLHEYLSSPLIGYRLVDGKYQRLKADAEGGIISEELGFRLVPERAKLRLFDLKNNRLLNPDEVYVHADQLGKELDKMGVELEIERQKSAQLAAELERLRGRKNGRS